MITTVKEAVPKLEGIQKISTTLNFNFLRIPRYVIKTGDGLPRYKANHFSWTTNINAIDIKEKPSWINTVQRVVKLGTARFLQNETNKDDREISTLFTPLSTSSTRGLSTILSTQIFKPSYLSGLLQKLVSGDKSDGNRWFAGTRSIWTWRILPKTAIITEERFFPAIKNVGIKEELLYRVFCNKTAPTWKETSCYMRFLVYSDRQALVYCQKQLFLVSNCGYETQN